MYDETPYDMHNRKSHHRPLNPEYFQFRSNTLNRLHHFLSPGMLWACCLARVSTLLDYLQGYERTKGKRMLHASQSESEYACLHELLMPPGHRDVERISHSHGRDNAAFQEDHTVPTPAAHEPHIVLAIPPLWH